WVAPIGQGEDRAKQLTVGKFDGSNGVAWTPDGRILCVLRTGDDSNIWKMDADGGNQKQLTRGAVGDIGPQFTPDGRWVIFWTWTESGSGNIQKVSIEGGDPVQLTDY